MGPIEPFEATLVALFPIGFDAELGGLKPSPPSLYFILESYRE